MTYVDQLEAKLEKHIDPFIEVGYLTVEQVKAIKDKVREHFIHDQPDLLDIRIIAKLHDELALVEVGPEFATTSLIIVERDGKFTAKVTLDPDDPDPQLTLEFIHTELNAIHLGVEVVVVEEPLYK